MTVAYWKPGDTGHLGLTRSPATRHAFRVTSVDYLGVVRIEVEVSGFWFEHVLSDLLKVDWYVADETHPPKQPEYVCKNCGHGWEHHDNEALSCDENDCRGWEVKL